MFEKISITDAAVKSLNTEIVQRSFTRASFSVEDANIRMRLDAQDPTTSTGMKVLKGSIITLVSLNEIRNFRAICEAGTAIINVCYS
jgi:hypothetical protein